ncbi:hypothetical protein ZWY2020_030006 [Hordeum vulgare]|nr:hypothetical protein ZWY2020_030006 [Hordeum vulgare]
MALAMRVKFAELEKFANLTLFALDDPAIFVGGGHDYVSAVRFHIVPDHRLTRADLHRLRPGTVLPTLAGQGQSLVVTHGAGSASSSTTSASTTYPSRRPTWWSTRASPSTASTRRSPASTSPTSPSRPPPTRRTAPAASGGPSATAPPQRLTASA